MLTAHDLSYRAQGRILLEQVDLTLAPGRMIALVGPNGSGKSTLLRLLARQSDPDGGTLRLNGKAYRQWPAREFARQVAYLPQHPPSPAGLTVRELVAFGRYPWRGLLGRTSGEDRSRVAQALARVDMAGMAERPADQLSGGERQRMWLAMMLAQDARYMVLDEPTSALDLGHQAQVLRVLRSLVDEAGLGIVLVVHDLNMAAHYCDELVGLKDGRPLASGVPDRIMSSETLERLFDVPMTVVSRPDAPSALAVVRA